MSRPAPSLPADASKVLVGLIGAGIQRSQSPSLHMEEGRALGLDYRYEILDVDLVEGGAAALPRLLDEAEARGFAGLNITFPCKQQVIPLLHDLSDDARSLQSVNTVVFQKGKRIGYNTDWWGFAENFRRGMPDVKRDRVVLVGAGGAAASSDALRRLSSKPFCSSFGCTASEICSSGQAVTPLAWSAQKSRVA